MSAVFASGPTYAATGSFTSSGKWLEGGPDSVDIGVKQHKYQYPGAPGVDGTGSRDFGFEMQLIRLRVIYCDSSAANVASAMNSDEDNLINTTPGNLTLDGITYHKVNLIDFKKGVIKSTGLPEGTYWAQAEVTVRRMRTA